MEVKPIKIKVRDLIKGYHRNEETGRISGYDGKLDIRPAYQREFVYKDKQRDAVIETVNNGFPLNIMYWAKTGEDSFEVLDGQQRTISICEYCTDVFHICDTDGYEKYFANLSPECKNKILDYELDVYQCEGNDTEKLAWFKIVNISGEKLTDQELRNAVYTGSWLFDAKKYFSHRNCPASELSRKYLNGSSIKQENLETVLTWISNRENTTIEEYMARHQHDENARELWNYFDSVMNWVERIFPVYNKNMKGLPWGEFYNQYKENTYNTQEFCKQIDDLLLDEDVTNQKGIYEYLLSNKTKENCLNIRAFPDSIKHRVFTQQQGLCNNCKEKFDFNDMEGDHIIPWSKGGHTTLDNCQMLCKKCNGVKSDK